MVQYSILIPLSNGGEAIARQLPELNEIFGCLALPYEIICIDDASDRATAELLEKLLRLHERMRLLRSDDRRGLSAALSAGMAAAHGDIVITIAPGNQYPARQIPTLISRLSRGDLVFGRRRRKGWAKAWRRLARIPRWLLLGLEVRDPDCLFWAARREAIADLHLARGMFRYLPSLVAARGFRVSEVTVEDQAPATLAPFEWPNPIDLLVAWWLKVRSRAGEIRELRVGPIDAPHLKIARFSQRRPAAVHATTQQAQRFRSA